MKILFLTKTLARNCGGGRMSYEITSRMMHTPNTEVLVGTEQNSDVYFEQTILKTNGIWELITSAYRVRKLAKQYDVVHALDGWPFGFIAFGAVLGTSKKLFISGVGTYTIRPLDMFPRSIFVKWAYKRAQEIFCISTYVKDELLKRLSKVHASVVHLGTTKFPEVSKEALTRSSEKYNIPENVPMVLSVGAVKDRKGQLDTVQAISLLVSKYPAIKYYIVGSMSDTVYVDKIKTYVKEHNLQETVVLVDDAKTDSDLAYFYSRATVFALNSNNGDGHFEGFGLVFLEAAEFGVPGVGSAGCGIEDAIDEGRTGHLAPQRNHKVIAEGIERILENHEQYKKNALDWPKHFSWDTTVSKMLEGYQD